MSLGEHDLMRLRELEIALRKEGRVVYANTVALALDELKPTEEEEMGRFQSEEPASYLKDVPRKVCWRAPNPHPSHWWTEDVPGQPRWWCQGVQGKTMY